MEIEVVWGTAEGETKLSAYDRALSEAGIHNFNLINLSSIIPPEAKVKPTGKLETGVEVGDFKAVVQAENRSTVPDSHLVAGLSWINSKEGGVFFEETAGSREECESKLIEGIRDASRTRGREIDEAEVNTKIVEKTVGKNPTSVVVCAVYESVRNGKI